MFILPLNSPKAINHPSKWGFGWQFHQGFTGQRQNPIWGSHGHPGPAQSRGCCFWQCKLLRLPQRRRPRSHLLTEQDGCSYRVSLLTLTALCDRGGGQGSKEGERNREQSRAQPFLSRTQDVGQAGQKSTALPQPPPIP